jgi:chemotaxis protein CheD
MLQPGELYVSDQDELIFAILGSCVAVCLFDDINCIGGMNHYRLSTRTTSGRGEDKTPDQYADDAMTDLVEAMRQKGALISLLKAKVFGGATMSSHSPYTQSGLANDNIALANRFLKEHGIVKVSENTGGNFGRRILFHAASGMVLMQPMGRSEAPVVPPSMFDGPVCKDGNEFRY